MTEGENRLVRNEIDLGPNDDGPSVNCDCPQLFGRRRAKNRPFASPNKIPIDELARPIAIQVTNNGHLRRSLGQQTVQPILGSVPVKMAHVPGESGKRRRSRA